MRRLAASPGQNPKSERQNPRQTPVIETKPILTERLADFNAGYSEFALESYSFVFVRFISLEILRTQIHG
ncbi:MAG TPA: hypothetical protein VEB61_13700 [Candidatus Binatia bacterium]|nr:hypothetical protein [Candidatus Binatia bacterium]